MLPLARPVMHWMMAPAGEYKDIIAPLEVTDGISIIIKLMLWGGSALSFPLLLFFIMRFVFPGLKQSERTLITFCLTASTVFFVGGVSMAYAKVLGKAIEILMLFNKWLGIPNQLIAAGSYIRFSIKTILAFGVAFQLPLILLALGWMGIVSSTALRKQRRVAIVSIFVLAMFLTPPDPFSQTIMAIPMYLLFEGCIWIIRLRELARGKAKEQSTEIVKQ